MGQQVSMDSALAAFRQRHGELAEENVLLRAQASELEARCAQLEEEVRRLQETAEQPTADEPETEPTPFNVRS